jgi:hypothetical protein
LRFEELTIPKMSKVMARYSHADCALEADPSAKKYGQWRI